MTRTAKAAPWRSRVPDDLYKVYASIAHAMTLAENFRNFVTQLSADRPPDRPAAEMLADLATQLLAQNQAAWRAFPAVEAEIYTASATGTSAHGEALRAALEICGILYGQSPDGKFEAAWIQQNWTMISTCLTAKASVPLWELGEKMKVELHRAADKRSCLTRGAGDAASKATTLRKPVNDLQRQMLEALAGKALTLESLASKCDDTDPSTVHRALEALRSAELVQHAHGIGFYRPDALPPGPTLPRANDIPPNRPNKKGAKRPKKRAAKPLKKRAKK